MATQKAPTTLLDRVWGEAVESGDVDVIDDALTDDSVEQTRRLESDTGDER